MRRPIQLYANERFQEFMIEFKRQLRYREGKSLSKWFREQCVAKGKTYGIDVDVHLSTDKAQAEWNEWEQEHGEET